MTLLLRARGQPRPRQRPDRRSDMLRGAAVAVVVLGMVVSALVARGWQETIVRQRDERLDRAAASRTATVEGVMANYENALQAARSLWVASDSVSRREFNAFARSLDLPARERPVAFELFVPVYRRELRPEASVGERRRELVGWATGQFRAGDFLNAAMKPWQEQQFIGVELSDEAVPDGGPLASWPEGFRARGPDVQRQTFAFGGRTFVLRFAALPGSPVLTDRTMPPPVVLAVGIALSLLFGAMLWLLAQVGALYREVGRLARTDSLTGVPNRRAWDEELPRELARAARSGQPLCVALLDLDHFKHYNDRHGHQAGDRFLKEAAAAWQAVVRKTDLVARYGGEEFAILLPDCGLDNAIEIADRLRTAQPEGTCSLGVAQWDGREDTTSLVARADRALYAAKDAGRDRINADAPTTVEPAAP